MEHCECYVNRIINALQGLINAAMQSQQTGNSSITDSGETLSGLSNPSTGNGYGTIVLGLIGLLLMALFMRMGGNQNKDKEKSGGVSKLNK